MSRDERPNAFALRVCGCLGMVWGGVGVGPGVLNLAGGEPPSSDAYTMTMLFGVFAGAGVLAATVPSRERSWMTLTLIDKQQNAVVYHNRCTTREWPDSQHIVEAFIADLLREFNE